jgi:hypothetical protein
MLMKIEIVNVHEFYAKNYHMSVKAGACTASWQGERVTDVDHAPKGSRFKYWAYFPGAREWIELPSADTIVLKFKR